MMNRFFDHDAGRQRRSTAFTLIELLVVISIIALLISLLLPAMQSARDVARTTQCLSNLRGLALAHFNYTSDYGVTPSRRYYWTGGVNPDMSYHQSMREYVPSVRYRDDPTSIWFCPNDGYLQTPHGTTQGARAYSDAQIWASYGINRRLGTFGSNNMAHEFWMQHRYAPGKGNTGLGSAWVLARLNYDLIYTPPTRTGVFSDSHWVWQFDPPRRSRLSDPNIEEYQTSGGNPVPTGPVALPPFGSWHGNSTGGNIGFLDGRASFYTHAMIAEQWDFTRTDRYGPYAFNY